MSHPKDKRQRPDPGPRCDPADVEIWEQLQRALTKLDQAERREEELRRDGDELEREYKALRAQLEQVRKALESCELERNAAQSTKYSDNAYLLAQRDTLAEALRRIVAWDDAEKPHKNLPLLDCAELARRTLDALDHINAPATV